MSQQTTGATGPLSMLASVVAPFWFKVNPWARQTGPEFFMFVAGCCVTFFFGYMRWFCGAWRPLFVMIVALLIRVSIIPLFIFVIWFLFLHEPGCWQLRCTGEPETGAQVMARYCKEHPEDSRCAGR